MYCLFAGGEGSRLLNVDMRATLGSGTLLSSICSASSTSGSSIRDGGARLHSICTLASCPCSFVRILSSSAELGVCLLIEVRHDLLSGLGFSCVKS